MLFNHFLKCGPVTLSPHLHLFKTTLQTLFDYRFPHLPTLFQIISPPPPPPSVFQTGTALMKAIECVYTNVQKGESPFGDLSLFILIASVPGVHISEIT